MRVAFLSATFQWSGRRVRGRRSRSTEPGRDATGFGLYVAETVVDEQGWTISVGESEVGGARFDVSGVDRAE